MEAENQEVIASSSSQRKRKRRKIRRIIRKRRNEKQVKAPSSFLNDVVEEIFLRIPVKALIRLKTLSKHWRLTIESPSFEERHLKIAKRYHMVHPKVMVITEEDPVRAEIGIRPFTDIGFRTLCLESASLLSFTRLHFTQGFNHAIYVSECCNGLFSIHSPMTQSVYIVNPATRWLRQLPPAWFQVLVQEYNPSYWWDIDEVFHLAFVKATDYKLVWMYNSNKYKADSSTPNDRVTQCEVFDFKANAWRYLPCTPSYRIYHAQKPAYANGSVYWYTEPYYSEIKVIALNINTETFRLLPKINPAITGSDPQLIETCVLDNNFCITRRDHVRNIQEIWRLKPPQETWEKIFTIDIVSCSFSRAERFDWNLELLPEPSIPVVVCKNKQILLSHSRSRGLVKYDPLTKSPQFFFRHPWSRRKVTYIQSLISHI